MCSCLWDFSMSCHMQNFVAFLLNSWRPRQNGRHFADDIFKCIFLNENEWISLKISLKFVLKGPINNIPALVQIMAWRRPGDKPLQGSTLSFLAGCPKSHFLGWYRNFLVYLYLKLDNQFVIWTCPKDKLGWIWRADDPKCRTLHYLNQWCLFYWRIYTSLGLNELTFG